MPVMNMGLFCVDTAKQHTLNPMTVNTRNIYITGERNLLIVSQELSKAPFSNYFILPTGQFLIQCSLGSTRCTFALCDMC